MAGHYTSHVTSNRATVTVFVTNHATLMFDLLTSGSMHAEWMLYSICVPRLVLIAQAVLLLERGQSDKQTNRQTYRNDSMTYPRRRLYSRRE